LKILFITHLYFPAVGGAERVFQRIAEGLAARGHDVTVLTSNALSTEQFFTRSVNAIPLRENLNGVKIMRESIRSLPYRLLKLFDKAGRRTGRLGVFYRPLVFGPHFRGTFREVIGAEYDAVIAGPTPTSAVFYGIFYKWMHRSTNFIIFPHMHIKDRLHTTCLNRWALRRADRVFALTDAEKRYLNKQRIGGGRIFRIVNAVDDHVFSAAKSADPGLNDYVLYLGQEGEHKRIPLLLRAMRNIWDRGFGNRLVIAGARTDFSSTLDKILANIPDKHRQRIHRYNDIPEDRKAGLLDNCRVLVNPSSFEAFGIVFLEAWARHKPVIGAGIAAVREIIKDGENGLIFQDKNVRDLENKIAILLEDRALADRLGEAGYKEVAANYRWDAVIRRVEEVL
jgi:glycogen(starch) synthase